MRLVTVLEDGQQRAAALVEQNVVDLQRADPRLPSTVVGLLRGGPAALERARELVQTPPPEATKPRSAVKLLAPIPRPPKIVCIGVNYADHAAEAGRGLPTKTSVFLKAPSCVVGPGERIVRPSTTQQLDYEIELAVVIGQTARRVTEEQAVACVAGYTILNDVSARDLQRSPDGGIIVGKNFDTSAPMGPFVALVDEVPDAGNLRLRTWVNDQLRQDGTTHNLIFGVPSIVSFLSQQLTLEPGDVIATGTPSGVGLGMKPQVWLQPGDRIRMEIDRLGVLENEVTEA